MYKPSDTRYDGKMPYKFCGNSGLMLPKISLGLWHNFGDVDDFTVATDMIKHAFDNGITHFDLANNYGPSPGSAEVNFGKILKDNFAGYRDELIISSKAGHEMWRGPYGDGSSRKNLMASIDQSLRRTGLEYFDIFYSHRYDGITPVEETMQALIDIVRQGKALYAGISKYPPREAKKAYDVLAAAGVKCLIHQDRYSMLSREVEEGTLQLADAYGCGFIAFSPLAQGLLTDRYINGIPEGSRAARPTGFLQCEQVTEDKVAAIRRLNEIAKKRGHSLAQMALAWILKDERVTSVIIGASSVRQLDDNLKTLRNMNFTKEELSAIEQILSSVDVRMPK
ncbi:L-glyceraldehyde 3-phosphate reductase [termite gut metagenome]|uniref:L-glyceraldehyde 3-phosphate reductase n=1 Tax=termite gut metagenome TaxID=433724 RepID=A0A5J4QP31_9ZZZZ